MSTFPFFRHGIRMLYFVFSYLVKEYKYWKLSTNTANIVLFSANQIADISSCKRYQILFTVKWNSVLSYRRWITSISNKNWHGIFVSLYSPNTKQNLGWMLTRQSNLSDNATFFFFSKFNNNIFNDNTQGQFK